MSENTVQTLIYVVLGAGGATFIWTIVKSYLAIRGSADLREDKAIARLEQFESDCREQLRSERECAQHWRNVAGTYQYTLNVNGIPVPETKPEPGPPAPKLDI